jgi:hypothetical protein
VIGAIVVSYESADDLDGCLASLLACTASPRVVVVDNASSDGSAELVRQRYGNRVELIALSENTGFAGGCNRGLAALPDVVDTVACVNPDVRVAPECLERCEAMLAADSGLAGVAPRLMRPDGVTVDSVGQGLRRLTLEVADHGYGEQLTEGLQTERPVLSACGALAVYRRAALEAIADGGEVWAEAFFCFWEDLELGWRLSNRGWQVRTCPQAVAVHGRGAGAAEGAGPLRWRRQVALEACIITNRWMTLIRHLHTLDLLRRLPVLLAWDSAVAVAGVVRRPSLAPHVVRRLPRVVNELRCRGSRPRRRLQELPCWYD